MATDTAPVPDDVPYLRALRDPEFLQRFADRYQGSLEPLEALRLHAGRSDAQPLDDDAVTALYGRATDAPTRERIALALNARRDEARAVAEAVRSTLDTTAADPLELDPAAAAPPDEAVADEPAPATSEHEPRSPRSQARVVFLVVGALACIGVGFGSGTVAAGGPAHPVVPVSATPRELPARITFDNRDGQQALLVVQSGTDPRSADARLPPVTGGYDLATTCLAKQRRPAHIPSETVLLLSDAGAQIARFPIACDGDERRFHVLAQRDTAQTVRLVIDVDTTAVQSAWVTLNPAGT